MEIPHVIKVPKRSWKDKVIKDLLLVIYFWEKVLSMISLDDFVTYVIETYYHLGKATDFTSNQMHCKNGWIMDSWYHERGESQWPLHQIFFLRNSLLSANIFLSEKHENGTARPMRISVGRLFIQYCMITFEVTFFSEYTFLSSCTSLLIAKKYVCVLYTKLNWGMSLNSMDQYPMTMWNIIFNALLCVSNNLAITSECLPSNGWYVPFRKQATK